MATNINAVTLTGWLTSDPEVKETANANLTKFRIGVNGQRKVGDKWEDDPNFINIVAFNGIGSNCAEYLKKGSRVAIQGRLNWSTWQTDSGDKREALEVIANSVEFLSPKE